MPLVKNIRKALRILSREGWRALVAKGAWKLAERRDARRYAEWIRESALTPERRDAMRSEIDRFARRPLISVIVPVYDIDEKWLRLCIGSVKDQIYENWELCIADDKSRAPTFARSLTNLRPKIRGSRSFIEQPTVISRPRRIRRSNSLRVNSASFSITTTNFRKTRFSLSRK
ncbi:MAG: glycosyltransferase [Acidobacteria bacterium]|nr:glycosyltransferase [Acidobacteriota bacterium]